MQMGVKLIKPDPMSHALFNLSSGLLLYVFHANLPYQPLQEGHSQGLAKAPIPGH
jgi:hypothetical protein